MKGSTGPLVIAALCRGGEHAPGALAAELRLPVRRVARVLRLLAADGKATGRGAGSARRYRAAEGLAAPETIATLTARMVDVIERASEPLTTADLTAILQAPRASVVSALTAARRAALIEGKRIALPSPQRSTNALGWTRIKEVKLCG